MYSKAKEKGILRGRSIQLLWQLLCLLHGVPPTLEDMVTQERYTKIYFKT